AVDLARVGRTFNSPEGRFEIGQRDPSGPHEIEILADGFPPTSFKDVVPLTKESDEEPVFALERGRVLEGIVVDGESGAPLEGIRVQASASEHAASIIPRDWDPFRQVLGARDTLTDRDGRFTFDETEPLHILVRAKGRQSFYLAPDDRARYTIPQGLLLVPLSRGEILEGVVLGPERPLAGVEVKIARRTESGRKGDAAFEIHGSATSDADGRFAFHDLAPGEHRLTTKRRPEKPDDRFEVEFRTFVDVVSGERASVELPVDRGSITLEGAVEGMDETESLFVEVTLRPVDDEGVAREIFFKTYKDWSFRYHCPDLAPGRYKVLANYWAEGGERTVELAPIELREGASASTASIDIATARAPEATR
ncbi:MAG TPA: hypothetical protein VK116_11565, partial [Planctomycetota bacterium]|nr:hypothetical protein [Planctomycetota bacterium]